MKVKHLSLSVMLMGATIGAYSTGALASGYHFGSQSVAAQGTAHANGAEAADASTLFYNPAGMARLKGTNFSGGLTLVVPNSEFKDEGSVHANGTPTGGGNGGDFAPGVVAAPSFYLTHEINDRLSAGVGVFVPYGAKLDYGDNWAGRYALQSVDLMTLNINPSMSFRLDEKNSFGFGVSMQYMDAKLKQAADTSAAAGFGVSGDGQGTVKGDDWGFGWNIGYMFELNDATRFGLAYRSQVKHKLEGTWDWDFSKVTGPAIVVDGIKAKHPDSDASVEITTPESASLNAFHQLNDTVALMGDLTWTRHSRLNEVRIKQSTVNGVAQGDLVIRQNWKDTYKLSLGMNYKVNDAFMLRTGVAYDQSPVKSDEDRHVALPDSDRYWFSLGGNYKLSKASSVDVAYSYVYFKDAKVNYKDGCASSGTTCTGNGETTKGTYKTNMHLLGVQYNYQF